MNRKVMFKLRLYIAGGTENSAQAVANLTRLCLRHLPGRHHIELIDVLRDPKRALEDHIYMTPTLVKLSPIPIGKIVGTLTDPKFVLQLLGVLVAS